MTLVRLILDDPDWDVMDLTPNGAGIWEGIQFTAEPTKRADYVVLLFNTRTRIQVSCPPGHLWAVVGEPPNEYFGGVIRQMKRYSRVYNPDERLTRAPWIPSHPALGWQIKKTYDELRVQPATDKALPLSWITSDIAAFEGHRRRLRFLDHIREQVSFDLFGRGFTPVVDKWQALAPYRYSMVVENYRGPYYWSEKLTDALLAWTMPIYCGCTRLDAYFPSEAVIQFDIADPDAIERVKEAVHSDAWLRNRDAIAEARNLILNRYQPIAFLASEILGFEAQQGGLAPDKDYVVDPLPRPGFGWRVRERIHRQIR
jgi:hypothetical protein